MVLNIVNSRKRRVVVVGDHYMYPVEPSACAMA